MFDSIVNDMSPGKLQVCGWPWHGRMDYGITGQRPHVTLSNGTKIQLDWIAAGHIAGELDQHGTVWRFRDPRAADVERTPEQLAVDQSMGIEWRADLLYSPRESILYGYGPRMTTDTVARSRRSWIYHGAGKNWRVVATTGTQLRFDNAIFLITRNKYQNETFFVSTQMPFDYPRLTELTVIDAVSDGSRVLLGRFQTAGNVRFAGDMGAASTLATDYWELRISYNENTARYSAQLVSVRNAEETAGSFSSSYTLAYKGVALDAELGEVYRGGDYEYAVYSHSMETIDRSVSGSGGPWPELQPGLVSLAYQSQGVRTVGAYYDDEGVIRFFTANYGGSSEFTGAPVVDNEYTETRTYRRSLITGDFDLYYGSVNSLTTIYTNQITGINTGWFELRRDDVVVSRLEASMPVSTQLRHVSYVDVHPVLDGTVWGSPVFQPPSSMVGLNYTTVSMTYDCLLDGVYLYGPAGEAYASPNAAQARYSFFREAGLGFFKFGSDLLRTPSMLPGCTVYRYSPQLLAIAARTPGAGVMLGNAVSPVQIENSVRERVGGLGTIYGSWNPITGEIIRDALNPVSWI